MEYKITAATNNIESESTIVFINLIYHLSSKVRSIE